MAGIFKRLQANDFVNTKDMLHEVIPITGSIVSGTYILEDHIKNYSHGLFQTVYDYPYLSSSANEIFDITVGYSSNSALSSSTNTQNAQKINIYNQMAQVLVGHDTTGSILRFDQDGNIADGGNKLDSVFFLSFKRMLGKDEIKKGAFRLDLFQYGDGVLGGIPGVNGTAIFTGSNVVLGDYGAASNYRVNSPAGEYGIIYTSSATPNSTSGVGLVYYQAGVAVLTSSFFETSTTLWHPMNNFWNDGTNSGSVNGILTGSTIQVAATALRNRFNNIQFNNTTELNSTVYFCRLNHNEFNYSSNPTYLSSSKIVVKNNGSDKSLAYVTGIGLYSADNELLAVAKLSEPLKKSSDNEITIRVRLDY